MPPTLLWTPSPLRPGAGGRIALISSSLFSPRHFHRGYLRRRFSRFRASGCFFNGISQVCYFESFLPFLCFGDFDFGFAYGGRWADTGDDSAVMEQPDMSGISPPGDRAEENAADLGAENSPTLMADNAGTTREDWELGPGAFVLVLKHGTTHVVMKYWAADGYLEYISLDGTRSHIPLEALDLQSTVIRNERRGLPFVLRSTPGENP
jgi:hypothetical protein